MNPSSGPWRVSPLIAPLCAWRFRRSKPPERGLHLFCIRGGKVTRLVDYLDPARALSELGLAPESETPMSDSANIELVRSIYAAMQRGDWTSADWVDPEIEMIVVGGPEPVRWIGRESVRAQNKSFSSVWGDYRVEAEQVRELDDERMLVLTRYSGRAKTSGLEVRTEGAHVLHVRDGKVTRYVRYWDRDRALADLGLASATDSPNS